MLCRNCGSRVEEGTEACPFCNYVFQPVPPPGPPAAERAPEPPPPSEPEEAPAAEGEPCPVCGFGNVPGSPSCRLCLTIFESAKVPPAPPPRPVEKAPPPPGPHTPQGRPEAEHGRPPAPAAAPAPAPKPVPAPAPKPAPAPAPKPATAPQPAPAKRRRPFILIVDDDENFSQLMADFLESQGVQRCTRCTDVKQALIQAESIDVGLVLMDVMLPAYGSGFDGYRMLRASPYLAKDLPILFVTAMPPEKFQALLPPDPRVTVVFKPVELPELAQQIRRLTGDLFLRND